MQVSKRDIHGIFHKLNLEARSTGHHYAWLMHEGRKILRVHVSHGKGDPGEFRIKFAASSG
ncbi:MAG: hypothetical protein EA399_15360 [Desulfovibrionales bacterium]|nr:MAG: hypothetical protein EA399_15360 [Desulfovibrionales bacterium]